MQTSKDMFTVGVDIWSKILDDLPNEKIDELVCINSRAMKRTIDEYATFSRRSVTMNYRDYIRSEYRPFFRYSVYVPEYFIERVSGLTPSGEINKLHGLLNGIHEIRLCRNKIDSLISTEEIRCFSEMLKDRPSGKLTLSSIIGNKILPYTNSFAKTFLLIQTERITRGDAHSSEVEANSYGYYNIKKLNVKGEEVSGIDNERIFRCVEDLTIRSYYGKATDIFITKNMKNLKNLTVDPLCEANPDNRRDFMSRIIDFEALSKLSLLERLNFSHARSIENEAYFSSMKSLKYIRIFKMYSGPVPTIDVLFSGLVNLPVNEVSGCNQLIASIPQPINRGRTIPIHDNFIATVGIKEYLVMHEGSSATDTNVKKFVMNDYSGTIPSDMKKFIETIRRLFPCLETVDLHLALDFYEDIDFFPQGNTTPLKLGNIKNFSSKMWCRRNFSIGYGGENGRIEDSVPFLPIEGDNLEELSLTMAHPLKLSITAPKLQKVSLTLEDYHFSCLDYYKGVVPPSVQDLSITADGPRLLKIRGADCLPDLIGFFKKIVEIAEQPQSLSRFSLNMRIEPDGDAAERYDLNNLEMQDVPRIPRDVPLISMKECFGDLSDLTHLNFHVSYLIFSDDGFISSLKHLRHADINKSRIILGNIKGTGIVNFIADSDFVVLNAGLVTGGESFADKMSRISNIVIETRFTRYGNWKKESISEQYRKKLNEEIDIIGRSPPSATIGSIALYDSSEMCEN